MGRRYLVRLDDACPTMRVASWRRLEEAFDELGVRPLVGVVPNCAPGELAFEAADPAFWDRIRAWEAKGWTLAAHGLTHTPQPNPDGCRSLAPFHGRGEFVGLSFAEQAAILKRAMAIFRAENVNTPVFMPPWHSFDADTCRALAETTDIRWITDGLSTRAFHRLGLGWIPQQVDRFRWFLPPGLWTIALHPNVMSDAQIDRFIRHLRVRRGCVVSFEDIIRDQPPDYGLWDRMFEFAYWMAITARRPLGRLLRAFR